MAVIKNENESKVLFEGYTCEGLYRQIYPWMEKNTNINYAVLKFGSEKFKAVCDKDDVHRQHATRI